MGYDVKSSVKPASQYGSVLPSFEASAATAPERLKPLTEGHDPDVDVAVTEPVPQRLERVLLVRQVLHRHIERLGGHLDGAILLKVGF